MEIVILKTGALGDVLRTSSILPGLHGRYPGARVTWVTAHGAAALVQHHPLVAEVRGVDPEDEGELARLGEGWRGRFERVLSFDDERELCRLASSLAGGAAAATGTLSGAYLSDEGERRYTDDVAPWFDMGLLSVHGKQEADRRKLANRETHPAIFARMLGIEAGEPELVLPPAELSAAQAFAERHGLGDRGLVIGLNTGAGGRWESKRLSVQRTVELAVEIDRRRGGAVTFLLLGGVGEDERNRAILAGLDSRTRVVDAGTSNELLAFAALVDRLGLLITSDSLALHVAIARRIPVVVFFAPTSAAEIELYGRGEKVCSTAADYCSYRGDADTSTLTPKRLADAVDQVASE